MFFLLYIPIQYVLTQAITWSILILKIPVMKKIYICLTFLFFPFLSIAQSKIEYTYDAAGNRIRREIIMQAQKAKVRQQAIDPERQFFPDKLEDYNIKIYPNPTHGFLKVSISGLKSTDKCSMCLYTIQGTQIITDNVNKDGFEINISNQPIGIYLLRITINNNSTIWKIVKK